LTCTVRFLPSIRFTLLSVLRVWDTFQQAVLQSKIRKWVHTSYACYCCRNPSLVFPLLILQFETEILANFFAGHFAKQIFLKSEGSA
jgi:hypothetical protein